VDAVFAAGWDEAALHFSVAICARFNLINLISLAIVTYVPEVSLGLTRLIG